MIRPRTEFLTDIIMRRTGAPEKVVEAKLYHCDKRRLDGFWRVHQNRVVDGGLT